MRSFHLSNTLTPLPLTLFRKRVSLKTMVMHCPGFLSWLNQLLQMNQMLLDDCNYYRAELDEDFCLILRIQESEYYFLPAHRSRSMEMETMSPA